MSEHATSAAPAVAATLLARNHFLLRRLHSLTGIVPIGVFLCFHLFTNMQMLFGTFQHEVEFIRNMPALLFLRVVGLWLPIGFHAVLGLVYTFGGKPNSLAYGYLANWRYTLQRVTGVVALVFIFLHMATLSWHWDIMGWFTPFFVEGVAADGQVVPLAHYSTAVALSMPAVLVFYVIGIFSAVFHWCNGLWTAAITWGATISVKAQRRWGCLCIALFLALSAATVAALVGAVRYKNAAPDVERQAYALKLEQWNAGARDQGH